jgi:hypothetical protein
MYAFFPSLASPPNYPCNSTFLSAMPPRKNTQKKKVIIEDGPEINPELESECLKLLFV